MFVTQRIIILNRNVSTEVQFTLTLMNRLSRSEWAAFVSCYCT
jgi:hypothetical protein